MTSKVFFHYILACSVLLASSFSVFHGSEHIAIAKTGSMFSQQDHPHAEHASHASEKPNSRVKLPEVPKNNHNVESLCEACLVFSNLLAFSLNYQQHIFLEGKFQYLPSQLSHSKSQSLSAYLSRAPPLKV